MAKQTMLEFSLMVIIIFSFLLSAKCYDTKTLNGLSLKMIHRDSPNSPMYRANLTDMERMEKYIEMSTARVKSIGKSYVSKNKSLTSLNPNDITIRPILSEHYSNYLVQVGIGTFEDEFPITKTYHLALDTGSQLIWTQCEGCGNNCFHQVYPYFPASRSSTYQRLPCTNCPAGAECQHNGCQYKVEYEDDAKVLVNVAKEVFTFASEGGRSHPIVDIIFGCGIDMQNFHEGNNEDNMNSGIMGLGYGFYSFVEQTQLIFGGNFSYCLQPYFSLGGGSPMYLRFGNDVLPQQIEGMQHTPMYRHGDSQAYHLKLEDISVDDQKLRINPSYFAAKKDGSGRCIIDSGTTVTYIIKGAFTVFKRAVVEFIRKNNKNVRLMRTPITSFDFCFKRYKGPVGVNLPLITFHFENNADFVVGVSDSFVFGIEGDTKNTICSNFLEDNHVTVLGVLQQVNKCIIYDTRNSLLHFVQADCSQQQ